MANVRNEKRRRRILEAAAEIVGREGIGAVTHRAVAAEAEVPLAATTYYFSSKEALLEQALTLSMQIDLDELDVLARTMMETPASLETFARSIAAFLAGQLRQRRTTVIAQYELTLEAARRTALQSAARASAEAYFNVFKVMLEKLGAVSPADDARLVVCALDGIVLDQLAVPRSHADLDELTGQVQRLIGALLEVPRRRLR
jgi:TetR/AcrR family transcriptional regulator, regulator of biofilm formation and stress response